MGFGASLAFFAIGAVLAFAVKWDVPGIDLQLIGWILMGVGVVGGVITKMYTRNPRKDVVEVVEPDIVYTTEADTVVEPHTHVHDPRVEPRVDETRPHVHREDVTRPPHSFRDGPV